MPSVPTLAALRPSICQMWRTKCTVEDLPLVPVTAAMVAGCRPAKAAAISATRRRGLVARTTTMAGSSGGSSASKAARIATAPRPTASAMNAAPSWREPARAANRKPGFTLRESRVRPERTGSRVKAAGDAVASALTRMSSLSSNAAHSRCGCGRRLVRAGRCRQRLALILRAMACVRRHELRRHHLCRQRSRGDFDRRQALLQVARQDAVERRDVFDECLDAGRSDHAGSGVTGGFGSALGLIERHDNDELRIVHGKHAYERAD